MPIIREMTNHWVDRLVSYTGKPINQIAKDTGISTGWFSNCKRRGTPIDGVVMRNLNKLAKYLNMEPVNLISLLK
jgi:hypothetical protein